ncbi:MAG: tail fiber protein [Cytophagales bacterium]|nr:tail fiber protein [Cytophagales bacterium]
MNTVRQKATLIVLAFLFNLVYPSYAQWSGSSTTTGDISRNGGVGLAGLPASSSRTLYSSPRFVLSSSGYATDGVTRWQSWSLESESTSVWGAGDMVFSSNTDGVGYIERFRIASDGSVGIGTSTPGAKLTVKGDVHAEEVRVDLTVPGPDYVFEEDYDLPTLENIESYIRQNKHLPGVPSAMEMEENGIDLGAMDMLLLKKVEELTLYLMQQNELIGDLKYQNERLEERVTFLESK